MIRQRRPDWDLYTAHSGAEALELLRANRFDCVMTDLQMPNMNGLALLQILGQDYPRCVRLVHSSQIETIGREIVQALCHRILSKPAAPDEVIATLEWGIRLARRLDANGTE